MAKALLLAAKAAEQGEVPVGALLVKDGKIIARGFNKKEQWLTPLGHAEAICLHRAARRMKSWRLSGATLYVTLEPCLMCAGAIIHSRIENVVYGARDPKTGACESLYKTLNDPRLNHQVNIISGVLEEDCSEVLKKFFKSRREQIRDEKREQKKK